MYFELSKTLNYVQMFYVYINNFLSNQKFINLHKTVVQISRIFDVFISNSHFSRTIKISRLNKHPEL